MLVLSKLFRLIIQCLPRRINGKLYTWRTLKQNSLEIND